MEIVTIIASITKILDIFPNIDNLIDLGRIYYRLTNYNKHIRLYIPNSLLQIYLNDMDAILYESYLGDDKNPDNYYINILLEQLTKTVEEIIEYLNKYLLLLYDETDLINNIIIHYYKDEYVPVLSIFLEDYLEKYTDNNSMDMNASIIKTYTSSIYESIELFKIYYNIELNFTGIKINYIELASVVLYHNIYNKVQKIIDDNYDSSKDTEDNDN